MPVKALNRRKADVARPRLKTPAAPKVEDVSSFNLSLLGAAAAPAARFTIRP